jgi:hypothetical protein
MFSELCQTPEKKEAQINVLRILSSAFYTKTGWDQTLYEYVQDTLLYTTTKSCDILIPFINILTEGIYTTMSADEFTYHLLLYCQESSSSLKYINSILVKALEILHKHYSTSHQ